jgi:hypothetical protein
MKNYFLFLESLRFAEGIGDHLPITAGTVRFRGNELLLQNIIYGVQEPKNSSANGKLP